MLVDQQPIVRRVLYCESNVDGTVGGSHYCLLYLAEALDRTRFEPVVVFYEEHALVPRFRTAGIRTIVLRRPPAFHVSALRGSVCRRHKILRGPLLLFQKTVNLVGASRALLARLAFLRRERISIVHLNNSILRHHDWMVAALLSGRKCITHERGINQAYSWTSRHLSSRLDGVICMSEAIRRNMVERGVSDANLQVLYDGMDPDQMNVQRSPDELRREFGIALDRPVVGIVGNVREWKGQETVVRAIGVVAYTLPNVACLIVGATAESDRHYETHLRRLIGELGLDRNVIFTGYQSNVADFLNLMDVAIHASVLPEPFGMVVLEAMAMSKAIIGSRGGGVPEMIVEGETGFTFPAGDATVLGNRILQLLGDPELARSMGLAGRRRLVDHFTVRDYASRVQAFYDNVLSLTP
jgi:glycosyltransferase involved in cell wall biosynthesis